LLSYTGVRPTLNPPLECFEFFTCPLFNIELFIYFIARCLELLEKISARTLKVS